MSERVVPINYINESFNIPVMHEDQTYKEAQFEHWKGRVKLEIAMAISDHDMAIDKMWRTTRGYAGDLPINEQQFLDIVDEVLNNVRP